MIKMPRGLWLALTASSLLAACNASTQSKEGKMGLDPATAAYQRYGYNDRLVEARLGPHRYRIPANYFRDQIGPDFQHNFEFLVQWPDLQPLPPGERSNQDMETFAKQITISPDYVDRVPMEGLLEKAVMPTSDPGSLGYDSPINRLDLRDQQPTEFGLTPYFVSASRLAAYNIELRHRTGNASDIQAVDQDDWYLARDAAGRITTVIKCGSHLRPDGFVISGDRLLRQGERSTSCTHYFLMPDRKVSFLVDYARVFLKDWKRIEDRARNLLTQHEVR